MIDLQAFRNIAANTAIKDTHHVYIANEDKTKLCFNVGNKPVGFKKPTGNELAQDSIYMRSQLLRAVRDRLGGTESAAFQEIETKLFGKLFFVKLGDGQFSPKIASKPLKMREIKSVLAILDAELAKGPSAANIHSFAKEMNKEGVFVAIGKNATPELKELIQASYKKVNSIADMNVRLEKLDIGTAINDVIMDSGYRYSTTAAFGWSSRAVPRNFSYYKGEIFSLEVPGGKCYTEGKVSHDPDDQDNRIQVPFNDYESGHYLEMKDVIARSVTNDLNVKFNDLEGDNLMLAQFIMANMQKAVLGPLEDSSKQLFDKNFRCMYSTHYDSTYNNKQPDKRYYKFELTEGGGLRFTVTRFDRIDSTYRDDLRKFELNWDNSYRVSTLEYEYSPESMQKILACNSGSPKVWPSFKPDSHHVYNVFCFDS